MRLPVNPFVLKFHSDWIYSGQTSKDNTLILDHSFFGITPEYKLKIHHELFDFLFQAQGGFTYQDIYTMPLTIRNLYFSKLSKILEARLEQAEKQKRKRGRK